MTEPKLTFGEGEARVLKSRLLQEILDLPVSHEEPPEAIKEQPIWDEMQAAGLLSAKQCRKLTEDVGPTLGHLLQKQLYGKELGSRFVRLLYVPGEGTKTAAKVQDFIRLRYGIEQDNPQIASLIKHEQASPAPEVLEIDQRLSEILMMPLGHDALKLSDAEIDVLAHHTIGTVGDFLVLPKAEIERSVGLSATEIGAIRNRISAIIEIDLSRLRDPMLEAIRWKYAVMKRLAQSA